VLVVMIIPASTTIITDDERRALLDLVHREIDHSRFPLSERIRMLEAHSAEVRRAVAKAPREEEDKPRQRGSLPLRRRDPVLSPPVVAAR
jgi:hypothetical protein